MNNPNDGAQGDAPVRCSARLGGWVDAKKTLPPYLTPVLLLNVDRYMAYDPHGNWKGVGVLAGEEMWQPYWSVIGESGGLTLDAVTHWMPIPANPPNAKLCALAPHERARFHTQHSL